MVGVLAADEVRGGSPEEPSDHVEDRDHEHIGCRKGRIHDQRQRGAEDFRHHGLGNADHADTRRHVEAEHDPQQIELRCLERLIDVNVVVGDHLAGRSIGSWWCPAGRTPAFARNPVGEGRDDHHDQIDDAEREEGPCSPGVTGTDHIDPLLKRNGRCCHLLGACDNHFHHLAVDFRKALAAFGDQGNRSFRAQVFRRLVEQTEQIFLDRRCDHRSTAKAHDGHAGGHAAPVREPPDQGGNG